MVMTENIDPKLLDAAIQLCGDEARAVEWLLQPAKALGYERPVDVDIDDALNLIGRLEHGVYT
jgi:uncharacterized protein (DUF2384 family)